MSSKRRQAPAPASASEESKKSRGAETPALPPAICIDSLPRHLLTEIFSFAPRAARLKALSLVCKRWHTAALHAYDSLTFGLEDPVYAAGALASTLARFPSLTSLHLLSKLPHFILPTSLRKLTIRAGYNNLATGAATRGLVTFFAQKLPNLSILKLEYVPFQDQVAPMLRFLTTHCVQITHLGLSVAGPDKDRLITELAKLSWPSLCKLSLNDLDCVSFVEALPHLKELEVFVRSTAAEFMAGPDRLLTALARLDIEELTDDLLTHLRKFPRLRKLRARPPSEDLWHQHHDLLSRTMVIALVNMHWEELHRYGQLRWLFINRTACPALPTPVALPHLEGVFIGYEGEDGRFDISTGFLLAHAVLNAQPQIRYLALFVREPKDLTEEAAEEKAQRMEQLVALALTRNLRSFAIDSDGVSLLALLPLPAITYGWLSVKTPK